MGGGGSQSINQTFDMSVINQSIYEQITKTQSSASAAQANVQNLRIQFKDVKGCSIRGSQTIDASAIASSELTSETTTEIKNAITNEMQAAVQAQVEKATQAGNFQFGDKQNVNQNIQMEIQNIVDNTIVTETLNEAIAEQVSIQGGDLLFGNCLDSDIDFTQNITADIMAKTVTKALQDAIASSELLNQLDAAAGGGASSSNTGFAEMITAIGDAVTGPFKYAIIAAVLCCCFLIIALIAIGLSPAGQSATANLGKAGASRLGGGRSF